MAGWIGRWMDGWIGRWMDGWIGRWMDGWMDGWMCRVLSTKDNTSRENLFNLQFS